jgi:hypothetical protein
MIALQGIVQGIIARGYIKGPAFIWSAAARRLSQNSCPKGAESQSPGLAAFFAAYPGDNMHDRTTLKGLRSNHMIAQPFQG